MNFVENYPKKSHLLKNSAFAEVYMKRNFKYVSAEDLTDIIQETTKCTDIQVGHQVTETDYGFLHYPIVWC